MHPPKFLSRRPSAAMVVAMVALFAALGGASYAAISLPKNSVGTRQLRKNAVTSAKLRNGAVSSRKIQNGAVGFNKIHPGAVGRVRINKNQVQERVGGVCTSGAITSITNAGKVTCAQAAGVDIYTADSKPVAIGTSTTKISSQALPAGDSFLLTANPSILISGVTPTGSTGATGTTGTTGTTGATESVAVTCTLEAGSNAAAKQTRSVLVDLGANGQGQTIPLMVTLPSSPAAVTATVSCSKSNTGSVSPAVAATTSINAMQTATNTSEPYTG